MTIASEIQRIKTNIANAYTTCDNKGATMPAAQNSANLADCIDSISGGGGGGISTLYAWSTTAGKPYLYAYTNTDNPSVGDIAVASNGEEQIDSYSITSVGDGYLVISSLSSSSYFLRDSTADITF